MAALIFSRRAQTENGRVAIAVEPSAPERRSAVIVTGLPMSGKSSLLESEKFPSAVAVSVTFSDVMDAVLTKLSPQSPKTLDELWPSERANVQRQAVTRLIELNQERLLVIDGHLIVPTNNGWDRGVPADMWDNLNILAIAVIHCPAAELAERQNRRGPHAQEEVLSEQTLVLSTAAHYSATLTETQIKNDYGPCLVHTILNSNDRRDAAEADLGRLILSLSGATAEVSDAASS